MNLLVQLGYLTRQTGKQTTFRHVALAAKNAGWTIDGIPDLLYPKVLPVLQLILLGLSNEQIKQELGLTISAIATLVHNAGGTLEKEGYIDSGKFPRELVLDVAIRAGVLDEVRFSPRHREILASVTMDAIQARMLDDRRFGFRHPEFFTSVTMTERPSTVIGNFLRLPYLNWLPLFSTLPDDNPYLLELKAHIREVIPPRTVGLLTFAAKAPQLTFDQLLDKIVSDSTVPVTKSELSTLLEDIQEGLGMDVMIDLDQPEARQELLARARKVGLISEEPAAA